MNELIEGKFVTVTNGETGKIEMGIVKRCFGKLCISVKRNNSLVNLTQQVLELYDVMYTEE